MDYDLNDWKMLLATSALIVSMVWDLLLDVGKNYLKVLESWWVPRNLFVLSALTIQILGYVDIRKVSIFGPSKEKGLEVLVGNQLKVDAARLTMCVFVGCVLPATTAGTEGTWSNLAALFVSLLFHIATEIYALQNSKVEREAGPWFVSSGVLLLVGASSLLVLLGAVFLCGMLTRDWLRKHILEILSADVEILSEAVERRDKEILSEAVERRDKKWRMFRSELMKSWFAARARKTWYFLLSSMFSPGAGMIVTICIVVMTVKVACRSSLLRYNNGKGNLTFYLQCIFILVGWILMLSRWFVAALYCAASIEEYILIEIISNFSLLAATVVKPVCPSLAYFLLSLEYSSNPVFTLRNILISVSSIIPLLFLCVLILAISILWLFCFICWHFSALVFHSRHVQNLSKLNNSGHFFDKMSIRLPTGYSKKDLKRTYWIVNKTPFDRIKSRMDEFIQNGRSSRLHSIMGNGKLAQSQRIRPNGKSWMETISSLCSDIVNLEIDVDMKDLLAAYTETRDVLKFVDCPDNIVMDLLNIFGTMNFTALRESMDCERAMHKVDRKSRQDLNTSLEETQVVERKSRQDLNTSLEETQVLELDREIERIVIRLNGIWEISQPYDQTVSNSLLDNLKGHLDKLKAFQRELRRKLRGEESPLRRKLRGEESPLRRKLRGEESPNLEALREEYPHILEELPGMLRTLVCHVIISCLLEAKDVMLKCTEEWAHVSDEKKIERAIELAGMVSAILETLVDDEGIHLEETRQVPSESGANTSENIDIEADIRSGDANSRQMRQVSSLERANASRSDDIEAVSGSEGIHSIEMRQVPNQNGANTLEGDNIDAAIVSIDIRSEETRQVPSQSGANISDINGIKVAFQD